MENKNLEEELKALEERVAKLRAESGGAPVPSGNNLSLIFSIIVGALIVGAAIIYSRSAAFSEKNHPLAQADAQNDTTGMEYVAAVSASDHIRGALNAPVTLVEFSDPECPFCKQFQNTLTQIVGEYGGKVAWVYRNFPLDSLHPKAPHEAEAIECANALGGNDVFWKYLDRLFAVTPSNNGLDPAELPQIAEFVGLNRSQFEACLSSGKYAEKVASQAEDARKSGGTGTPYTIILGKDGKAVDVISGAEPYYMVKIAVEKALRS